MTYISTPTKLISRLDIDKKNPSNKASSKYSHHSHIFSKHSSKFACAYSPRHSHTVIRIIASRGVKRLKNNTSLHAYHHNNAFFTKLTSTKPANKRNSLLKAIFTRQRNKKLIPYHSHHSSNSRHSSGSVQQKAHSHVIRAGTSRGLKRIKNNIPPNDSSIKA